MFLKNTKDAVNLVRASFRGNTIVKTGSPIELQPSPLFLLNLPVI